MPRFLHTADWQLGLKLRYIPGDRGAKARLQRFAVVERLAALAQEQAVDAVLVAGDVFDANTVGPDTIQAARDALARFAPIPVVLLAGNHDPLVPEGALARLGAGQGALAHVHLPADQAPTEFGGIQVVSAPWTRPGETGDLTRSFPARAAGDTAVRVVLAHGSVLDFGEETESQTVIDFGRLVAKGFDYVALGDWHGRLNFGPRTWYPGAPEATRFKEKHPGEALIVDITGPGAVPQVQAHTVGRTQWIQRTVALDSSEGIGALDTWLAELPERSWTLVELWLEGSLSLAQREALDQALEPHAEELLFLRVRDQALATTPSEADLAALQVEGLVGTAAAQLQAQQDPAAADALRLLYRLVQRTEPA